MYVDLQTHFKSSETAHNNTAGNTKAVDAASTELRRQNTADGGDGDESEGGGGCSSSSEIDDPNLYCVCRGRDDGTLMIECNRCHDWFHLRCIGISATVAHRLHNFFCPFCLKADLQLKNKSGHSSFQVYVDVVAAPVAKLCGTTAKAFSSTFSIVTSATSTQFGASSSSSIENNAPSSESLTAIAPLDSFDGMRTHVKNRFLQIFVEYFKAVEAKDDLQILSESIEQELFVRYFGIDDAPPEEAPVTLPIKSVAAQRIEYKSRFRTLAFNLGDNSNGSLRQRLKNGDITPKHFVYMSTEELANSRMLEQITQIKRQCSIDALLNRSCIDEAMKCSPQQPPDAECEIVQSFKMPAGFFASGSSSSSFSSNAGISEAAAIESYSFPALPAKKRDVGILFSNPSPSPPLQTDTKQSDATFCRGLNADAPIDDDSTQPPAKNASKLQRWQRPTQPKRRKEPIARSETPKPVSCFLIEMPAVCYCFIDFWLLHGASSWIRRCGLQEAFALPENKFVAVGRIDAAVANNFVAHLPKAHRISVFAGRIVAMESASWLIDQLKKNGSYKYAIPEEEGELPAPSQSRSNVPSPTVESEGWEHPGESQQSPILKEKRPFTSSSPPPFQSHRNVACSTVEGEGWELPEESQRSHALCIQQLPSTPSSPPLYQSRSYVAPPDTEGEGWELPEESKSSSILIKQLPSTPASPPPSQGRRSAAPSDVKGEGWELPEESQHRPISVLPPIANNNSRFDTQHNSKSQFSGPLGEEGQIFDALDLLELSRTSDAASAGQNTAWDTHNLHEYLLARNRYAVVNHCNKQRIKIVYLIPYASHLPLPRIVAEVLEKQQPAFDRSTLEAAAYFLLIVERLPSQP